MKFKIFLVVLGIIFVNVAAAVPEITGSPVVIKPFELLDWPQDTAQATPYLTEPTANVLNDLHGEIGECDMVLSTAGNYHMALKELWRDVYLPEYAAGLDLKTWFYTTSPPISPAQVANHTVQFGNLNANCLPQVAVGPNGIMNQLISMGVADGAPVAIIKNFGNVILIKKGNPKHIKNIWDLGRANVTLVTPNPELESGSFGNFSGSIYNIAVADMNPPKHMDADTLFNSIFNSNTNTNKTHPNHGHHGKKHTRHGNRAKWVTGARIMHREQPFMIANGYADAGVIFYHQALYITRTFPDKFDFIPLGGSKENPQPVEGNRVGTMKAVRISGEWSTKQLDAREALMDAFQSYEFSQILYKHGLTRP